MSNTKILCILDGYGLAPASKTNAVTEANTPNLDNIFKTYDMVKANASGLNVGLPDGQMGNSEVGHLNIGSGRIVYQDLTKISLAIKDGSFFENKDLLEAINHVKENNSSLHIMGLLSDGGVHSHIEHLYGLLDMCKKENVKNVYLHPFMDGRDTSPMSGKGFLYDLQKKLNDIGIGEIVSICGRYYAMDRDKNYDRTKEAYDLLTSGIDDKNLIIYKNDVSEAIDYNYQNDKTDEFVLPTFIGEKEDKKFVRDNDSIIFFNFRPDRARQITRCFVDDDFTYFDRKKIKNLCYVCFTDYDVTIKNKLVAFKKEEIKQTLGEVISKKGLLQLRTAETEKYAHVTFFFNGGIEKPYSGEDRVLVPSPKDVPTYDLKPEMSCRQVCEKVLDGIKAEKYALIVVNFANPDMVGHTGVLSAAIKALEAIDECMGKIYKECMDRDIEMFICADHGNCEKMVGEDGAPFTAHTSNPVPFCLVNKRGLKLRENGSLCDIAPTMLELMGIEKDSLMTGESLILH